MVEGLYLFAMKKVMDCFDIDADMKKAAIKQAEKQKISKAELYRRAISYYILASKLDITK